jgi:hypothetical protein
MARRFPRTINEKHEEEPMNARHAFAIGTFLLCGCGSQPQPGVQPASQEAADPKLTARAALGDPLPGLSAGELELFEAGKERFEEVESVEDGVGPVFNETSCAACHTGPVGGSNGRLETSMTGRAGDRGTAS